MEKGEYEAGAIGKSQGFGFHLRVLKFELFPLSLFPKSAVKSKKSFLITMMKLGLPRITSKVGVLRSTACHPIAAVVHEVLAWSPPMYSQ